MGHQSVEVAKASMAKANMGFVSLVPNLYRYAYPSKTMTYLEQGCPLLVAVEMNSCLARDVMNSGAGYVVVNGNVDALCETISGLSYDPELIHDMKKSAIRFSEKNFNRESILAIWSSLLGNKRDV